MFIYVKNLINVFNIKNKFFPGGIEDLHDNFYVKTNFSAFIVNFFLYYYNPVHYGGWLNSFPKNNNSLEDYEINLFKKLIQLMGGKTKDWVGLANESASAGNLHSLFLFKSLSTKNGYKKRAFFYTHLTHELVLEMAKILDFELVRVNSSASFQMDVFDLNKKLKKLNKDVAACIFLTIGYKKTGTSDDIEEISSLLSSFDEKRFFICVDAALDGLVVPFSKNSPETLALSHILSIAFDFHKYLGIPAGAGGIIFKNIFQDKAIINNFKETRSLLPALSVWFSLFSDERQVKLISDGVERAQRLREYFINNFNNKSVSYFYSKENISLFFTCDIKTWDWFKKYQKRYPIKCFSIKKKYGVKIYFLPQFSKKNLIKILEDYEFLS